MVAITDSVLSSNMGFLIHHWWYLLFFDPSNSLWCHRVVFFWGKVIRGLGSKAFSILEWAALCEVSRSCCASCSEEVWMYFFYFNCFGTCESVEFSEKNCNHSNVSNLFCLFLLLILLLLPLLLTWGCNPSRLNMLRISFSDVNVNTV